MKIRSALLALLPVSLLAGNPTHFDLQASFVPPKAKAEAAVAVLFTAKDPDVNINEVPAPRLKLDPSQSVLVEKAQPTAKAGAPVPDPGTTRYLDLSAPVRFPVDLASGATKGKHVVKGSVAFFYCSKREGWCRKGVSEVEIPVLVR